jgi:hypothetical protein
LPHRQAMDLALKVFSFVTQFVSHYVMGDTPKVVSHSQWLCSNFLKKWIIIWCTLFCIQSWVDMILLIFVKLKTLLICGKYQVLSIGPSLGTQLYFKLNSNRMLKFWVIFLHIGLEHWLKHSSPSRHNSWWEPESTKLNDIYAQKNLIMKILITLH